MVEKSRKRTKRKPSYVRFAGTSLAADSESVRAEPDASRAREWTIAEPARWGEPLTPQEADPETLARVIRLIGDSITDDRNKATSLRLNESLWKAAELAVGQGWAPSLTALVEQSVTARLVGVASAAAEQAALDEHYEEHPETRSELWEIALAAAEIDGLPVAEHPDLVRQAADALGDDADIDMILVWADGALVGSTR